MHLVFLIFFHLSDRYWDFCKKKQFLGTSWMGWGPVDWMKKVLPEAKLKIKWILFFYFFFILGTNTEISVWNTFGDQLNGFGTSLMGWGPIDWVRKVLREATFKNKWILFFEFFIFFYFSDRYWDICKKHFWGPVEWVWDQLTGWGKSCQKQN